MSGHTHHFACLDHGRWIRFCVRAIIFNRACGRALLKRNSDKQHPRANFIGVGLEIGETRQSSRTSCR